MVQLPTMTLMQVSKYKNFKNLGSKIVEGLETEKQKTCGKRYFIWQKASWQEDQKRNVENHNMIKMDMSQKHILTFCLPFLLIIYLKFMSLQGLKGLSFSQRQQ